MSNNSLAGIFAFIYDAVTNRPDRARISAEAAGFSAMSCSLKQTAGVGECPNFFEAYHQVRSFADSSKLHIQTAGRLWAESAKKAMQKP